MQRKRHINFKHWRKTMAESSTSTDSSNNSIQNKLHSIPLLLSISNNTNTYGDNNKMKNVKSNVLYSIPCVKSCAHTFCRKKQEGSSLALLCGFSFLLLGISCLLNLSGLISWFNGECSAASTTASLTITTPSMTTTATQGTTATVSTKVAVNVTNAKDYSLILKVDNANLTNGSTTIVPGNATTTNNTWGYKWDKDTNTSNYKSPSTTGTTLTVSALTNNNASFEGTLTFAAKFATNADPGSYSNTGSIMLTATPNAITLSSITNMQEMTPEICAASALEETKQLKDTRDNKLYWVAKLKDDRCWMVQNLDYNGGGTEFSDTATTINSGKTFKNFNGSSYFDPGVKILNGNTLVNGASTDTHLLVGNYYGYNAALPDYSPNTPSAGDAAQGICPDRWHIPTGNANGEFAALYSEVSVTDATKAPYYLTYTGAVTSNSGVNSWWSDMYPDDWPSLNVYSMVTYWSSSNYSTGDTSLPYKVYALSLSSSTLNASSLISWYQTGAVRCIANNQ